MTEGVPMLGRRAGRWRAAAAAALAFALVTGPASAAAPSPCRLVVPQNGQLEAELKGHRILLPVVLNGQPIRAILDTGASASAILYSAAHRLGLNLQSVDGLDFYGAGGAARVMSARVDLAVLGVTLKGARMLVLGSDRGSVVDMVLGQDLLAGYDLELDLAHHLVRLEKEEHCTEGDLAYWAPSYSLAPLETESTRFGELFVLPVQVNGRTFRAVLDTGAPVSVATLAVANGARVRLADRPAADVRMGGGVGGRRFPEQVAHVDSFAVGGEEIRNTSLRFGDLFGGSERVRTGSLVGRQPEGTGDMLLGYDFVAAHHLLISPSRRKMFFTFERPPVFDLQSRPATPASLAPAAGPPGSPDNSVPAAAPPPA